MSDTENPNEVRGGTLIADRIVALGVDTVFALSGAAHAPLLMALEDRGVTIVSTRHESGTVAAADGYARVTGKLGIALIIAEQGIPNAMGAIRTAHDFGSPVLVLTTRYPDRWIEPDIEVAVDLHEITSSTTKWRRTVTAVERVGEYFDSACKAALEGRPGVSVLIMPSNFMATETPVTPPPARPAIRKPAPVAEAIEDAAALLATAERPMLVIDSPAAFSGAGEGLRRLANECNIPALGMGLGRGLVPEVAPLGYPWPFGQRAAPQADVVVVVGATLDMRFGYGIAPRFGENTRFIHLSEVAEAIGRNKPVDVPVLGDMAAGTILLADAMAARGYKAAPWIADALKEREDRVQETLDALGDSPIHQIEIGTAIEATFPKEKIVVGDGADVLNFLYARVRMLQGQSYSDHNPLGSMGIGFPIAIGMAAGERELAGDKARPTVLVSGDGSIGFYLAELDSARRAGLKLIVVVSNDGIWGPEYHGQKIVYGRDVNTVIDHCDYATVAKGLGVRSESVADRAELVPAFERALAHDGPSLIDVRVGLAGGHQRKTDKLMAMVIFDDVARKNH